MQKDETLRTMSSAITRATTNCNQTISPADNCATSTTARSKNIMQWGCGEVIAFLCEVMGELRQAEINEAVMKHQVCGVDLIEMNEQNLSEIGIHTMHERKQVMRAIRQQRNDTHSTYGKFKVRMLNSENQKYQEISLKVSDNETKVKHILKQAFQVFTQQKCEISTHCLAKIQSKGSTRAILSNETIFLSLLHENPRTLDIFEVCQGTDFVTQASIDTSGTNQSMSTDSPFISMQNKTSSLERILIQSSPRDEIKVHQQTIADPLTQDHSGFSSLECFDRGKLLFPSFIDHSTRDPNINNSNLHGTRQDQLFELKNQSKRSNSRASQGAADQTCGIKLKASRMSSANMQGALKEKITIKRQQQHQHQQQRNHNATQMNSQESAGGNQSKERTVLKKGALIQQLGAPQQTIVPQSQQVQGRPRQNSQASQERHQPVQGQVASQHSKALDIVNRLNQEMGINTRLKPQMPNRQQQHPGGPQISINNSTSALESESKNKKKQQASVIKTPNNALQQMAGSSVGTHLNDQQKPHGKPLMKQNINMFKTLNEPQPQRIVHHHQRNSSKSSCYVASSDLTTERNNVHQFAAFQGQQQQTQSRRQNSKSGTRTNIHFKPQANNEDQEEAQEDQSSILQCSLEVQNTIQTVNVGPPAERDTRYYHQQETIGGADLNQILSDFLNEQKININIQQQQIGLMKQPATIGNMRRAPVESNNQPLTAKSNHSQSRAAQQSMLLEQDSLESQVLDEEEMIINQMQQNQRFDLIESQQAYSNEQDQLAQVQMREMLNGGSEQQFQQQMKQRAIKHIQTKSMQAFTVLTNQKKSMGGCPQSKNQQNANQIRRQNYVNGHINHNLQNQSSQYQTFTNVRQQNHQTIYGTFDNSMVSKTTHQIDTGSQKAIERGSSVGDQFYTIDNTLKENQNQLNRCGASEFIQPQRVVIFNELAQQQNSRRMGNPEQQSTYMLEQQVANLTNQQQTNNSSKNLLSNGSSSHIKIKNIGFKVRAPPNPSSNGTLEATSFGLQRANTMGGCDPKLRSNSNNTRQQVVSIISHVYGSLQNNRYGQSSDDMLMLDTNTSHDELSTGNLAPGGGVCSGSQNY